MILNLKEYIKDLEGGNTEWTVGKALANIILLVKTDPLRAYVMSQSLYKDEEIKLSAADLDWVKTAVTEQGKDAFTSLVLGQLLMKLNALKDNE